MTIKGKILNRWNDILAELPNELSDIYFSWPYVSTYESAKDTAECFLYRDKDNIYLFPYLKRINKLFNETFYDFETPYGYGGPIANSTDQHFIQSAENAFVETCKDNGMVAGFVRLCPWLKNHEMIADSSRLLFDRKTILMDLTPNTDQIWMEQVHARHRRCIKKAEKEGLAFEVDTDFKYIDEFIDLYNKTMRRVGADEFYFFPPQYFKSFIEKVNNNAFLGVVRYNGTIIAATIIIHDKIYGHYHLGCSNHEFLKLKPNNFMLYKAALYLKKLGIQHFHLGGGSDSSPDNSLYIFKYHFSQNSLDYYIGKFVFDSEHYNKICARWEHNNPEKVDQFKNHLLKYRF